MLQRGLLLPPDAALEAGLVDRLAPLDRLDDEAHALLDELLAVPDNARGAVKLQLREAAAEAPPEGWKLDPDGSGFVRDGAAAPSEEVPKNPQRDSTAREGAPPPTAQTVRQRDCFQRG